jgi:hypothetical protein
VPRFGQLASTKCPLYSIGQYFPVTENSPLAGL